MRLLTRTEYEQLIDGAELLRADGYGPKVYQTPGERIVKLFRVKRWWSSSMFYPYSLRFLRNSRRLKKRGIPCVDVEEVFYCHAIRRHGVIYHRLQGEPLDMLLGGDVEPAPQLYADYARFIADLHADRIYFRSLHPGNILRLPDGCFGLIDVGDMRFPLLPLTLGQRRRNFQHLLRSAEFADVLRHHPVNAFVDAYLGNSGLEKDASEDLRQKLITDFQVIEHAS